MNAIYIIYKENEEWRMGNGRNEEDNKQDQQREKEKERDRKKERKKERKRKKESNKRKKDDFLLKYIITTNRQTGKGAIGRLIGFNLLLLAKAGGVVFIL